MAKDKSLNLSLISVMIASYLIALSANWVRSVFISTVFPSALGCKGTRYNKFPPGILVGSMLICPDDVVVKPTWVVFVVDESFSRSTLEKSISFAL